jgi:glycosyl transferase family 2
VTGPAISLILPAGAKAERLGPTIGSLRGQSVAPEVIAVVTSHRQAAAKRFAPSIDAIVDIGAERWTPGGALNAGSAAATAPIHATIEPGRELPRSDWLERILAHHRRDEVAAVSGARRDREQQLLFEPRDLRACDWSERLSFSIKAAGWRATAWSTRPFPEDVAGAEDRIWAWWVLRDGGVLVVDPFLQLDGPPLDPPSTWSIFRSTADEWTGLVSAGMPVSAPSFGGTVRSWWSEIDAGSATPGALQRLNYYRLARALGRWVGGRRGRSTGSPAR